MTIPLVVTTSNYELWIGRTNQAISVINQLTDGVLTINGSIIWSNTSAFLNVTNISTNTLNANSFTIHGIDIGSGLNQASSNGNAAFIQANTATSLGQAAFNQANTNLTNITYINGVETTQNTTITAISNKTNSGYNQANAATISAQSGYNQANAATISAQAAYNQANTANSLVYNTFSSVNDVTTSRNIGTTYTNNTGKPMFVSVVIEFNNTVVASSLIIGAETVCVMPGGNGIPGGGYNGTHTVFGIVPPAATYEAFVNGTGTLFKWIETY